MDRDFLSAIGIDACNSGIDFTVGGDTKHPLPGRGDSLSELADKMTKYKDIIHRKQSVAVCTGRKSPLNFNNEIENLAIRSGGLTIDEERQYPF